MCFPCATPANLYNSSPYFSAGFGLMGVGAAATILRQATIVGTTALRRRMLVTLELTNTDPAFQWFLAWMAKRSSESSGRWARSNQLSVETTIERRKNGSTSALFKLVAGLGTHWFRYEGAWMQVKRERASRGFAIKPSGASGPLETIRVTTLYRDRSLFSRLLADARDLAIRGQEGKLVVNVAWSTEWRPFGQPRAKRSLQSVVLAPGLAEKIENDLRSFLARRRWYADRGIPYRRGYLLHGPPGSGKSSFIQALAGAFSYDICLLNLSDRGLTDDRLIHLLSNAPERSFILIEDIDAAFNKRVQTTEDGYQSSVTFSGFLNALDGVASGEERIIFMTTNHVEKLDHALIRPGRVDLSLLIGDATPEQARTLFTRFYGDDEQLEALAQKLEALVATKRMQGRLVSMAALQGLFILSSAEEAVARCPTLFVAKAGA
ncbi:hypothetical protein FISHEDRAFT_68018 [Fistulina hepatica ATCC 64428]|nr:hypothetical protein FISHEDRAFT_68018 [Fistulina hepatica ATCC 64428]